MSISLVFSFLKILITITLSFSILYISYTHDKAGNQTSVTEADSSVTSYGYNKVNELIKVSYPTGVSNSYTYDAVGNRTTLTHSGGGDSPYTWNYSYNAANELTRMAKTDGNWANFQYDQNGNRIAKVGNNYTTSYSYDNENRLTRVDEHNGKVLEYAYDGDGNLIKRTDLEPQGKVSSGLGIALYLYDINNDLPGSGDDDSNSNSIDKVGSLLGVLNNKAANAEMSFAPKLQDNPLSGIIKPNLNTNLSQVIAIYNGETGALDADYTYGLERISVHDEDTTTGKVQDPLYYLFNGTGNVSELTNPAGHASDKYRFDPYGVELPGGKMSPNANLTYLRNRYYEPETGVFMTRDLLPGQLDNPLTLNAYAYVTNNPLNFIDPLGLEKTKHWYDIPGAFLGGGFGAIGDNIKGLISFLSDIPGSIKGLGSAIYHYDQTYRLIRSGMGDLINEFNNGDVETKARLIGKAIGNVGFVIVGAKGLDKLADVVKATRVAKGAGSSVSTSRVGRWMSQAEYDTLVKNGKVPESFSGTTHVASPANIEAFGKQAKPGSIYVEFDVPSSSLKVTNDGWAKIIGPNSLEGRLAGKKGQSIPEMPSAFNIEIKGGK